MRTLITLSSLTLASVWFAVWAYIDERDVSRSEWSYKRTIDSLRHEIRMGPKPYCMQQHTSARTQAEHDSVMLYLSHYTRGELAEIKANVVENVALRGFIDTLVQFKDSLDYARGISPDIDN